MPFGAAASVWQFNRIIDALMYLSRNLLFLPMIHYVDDLGLIASLDDAWSSHTSFRRLCALLEVQLKPSKEQPPDRTQRVLGVIIDIQDKGITVKPDQERIDKLCEDIRVILLEGRLEPEVASRLTGKLSFVATSLFGQVGRGPLGPLYRRAHQACDSALTPMLTQALTTLQRVLRICAPRFVPYPSHRPQIAVLYADAYFQAGDDAKAGRKVAAGSLDNGWGCVCRTPSGITFAYGRAPDSLVRKFCRRKAYIYFLEVLAQLICMLVHKDLLPQFWIACCDNSAGASALTKGYSTTGNDGAMNNLLSLIWTMIAKCGWTPHFEWIPSELNVSDPISRGDLEIAVQSRWRPLTSSLHPLYAVLDRVADDLQYATGEAVDTLLALKFRF
jgi:hypothetical protein